jgi:indolepyruvate ferredoxin oxidoreductase
LQTAQEYAACNRLNVLRSAGAGDRFGIVAAGKSYLNVCQALRLLRIGDSELARHGIRLLKLGLLYPLERQRPGRELQILRPGAAVLRTSCGI